ncbi:beta-arrestin 1 [Culex quinquefasciatus]|uniref:Beta-arrestin 1 n=1 Tax=Culex quinquefasciatus TaxID=7176 RepID=B0XCC2_CULQU|nr:beta-arrestin 1 [Culex quinquefasciatus]|eukprot:XP_001867294.1 beta-arrestin 1 [Culex quinquefasciatus]
MIWVDLAILESTGNIRNMVPVDRFWKHLKYAFRHVKQRYLASDVRTSVPASSTPVQFQFQKTPQTSRTRQQPPVAEAPVQPDLAVEAAVRRDLAAIFPPLETDRPLTRLQERLIRKLGPNAYPFYFEVPPHCPASVSLQPAPGDTGKPCGVDYELKAFVGETPEDKPHKRNSVRLAIRKIMYAPSKLGEQPSIEVSKEYILKPNKIHLEASLDKELYHHGESLSVNVHIANNSSKTVKKIKVSVRQFADICLFSTAQYKCTVAEVESEDGCQVAPGFTLSKVFTLTPLLANNKDKWGLALDGQLKHEDTNLASSTLIADPSQRENLGIIVQYKVKVKLCITPLGGDLVAELPFILMHPKPDDDEPVIGDRSPGRTTNSAAVGGEGKQHAGGDGLTKNSNNHSGGPSGGTKEDGPNLIQLDGDENCPDDDIIFEDFARLRLKGAETEA